jgi:hypothetical protein
MRKRLAVLLASVALGGCFADTAAQGDPEIRVRTLELGAVPRAMGALELESALVLSSGDEDFGGLSGLWLSPEGDRLAAASDRGVLWTASLTHDGRGRLADANGWRAVMPGQAPGDWAYETDAESLADDGAGGLVIAYEGTHRLRRLPLEALDAEPAVVPTPELGEDSGNSGIEALTGLPDGSLLALSEGVPNRDGELAAWLIRGDRIEGLGYVRTGEFVPTGADRLGDVLFVLERQFSLLGGFANRIVALPVAEAVPGARLRGVEIGRVQRPLIGDNFEGIAARRASDGRILLYLISDDNFILLQQTILLQLAIDPAELERRLGERIGASHQSPEG